MKKSFLTLIVLVLVGTLAGAQELTTFGGYHTQLYGYTDERYTGTDKGDYLKTLYGYGGVEYLQRKLVTDVPELANFVLGAATNLGVQADFSSLELYAVPSAGISAQTILKDPVEQAGRFQLSLSGFGGFEEEWWGAQVGLSVFLKGYNEKSRQRRDAAGNPYDAPGRSWTFDNANTSPLLPNFQFRLGPVTIPHFVLSIFRGVYDPGYGALQARAVVPFAGLGSLTVGGTLFQTASVFVEPKVQVGPALIGVKAGTVLNYYDKAFTRVGIFEGLFVAGSVGFRW